MRVDVVVRVPRTFVYRAPDMKLPVSSTISLGSWTSPMGRSHEGPAMSFHPWESITGAILVPALVLLIPIHVGALLTVLTIMTVMGVTNHMGWEIFPRFMHSGPLGGWLITASHHQRHHQLYGCNYGLYFRFWDRLCGTDKGLGDFAHRRDRAVPRPAARSDAARQP